MSFIKSHLYGTELCLYCLSALAPKPLQRFRGIFMFSRSQQVVGWFGEKEERNSEHDGDTGRHYGEVAVCDVRANTVFEQKPDDDQQLQ